MDEAVQIVQPQNGAVIARLLSLRSTDLGEHIAAFSSNRVELGPQLIKCLVKWAV